jgi:hypothetical protein
MLTATDIVPYKHIKTGHEAKFATFLVHIGREDLCRTESRDVSAYAIQVSQIDLMPESFHLFKMAALKVCSTTELRSH